jgi:anaerobic glycerol-3-phosphate dehydrogenase
LFHDEGAWEALAGSWGRLSSDAVLLPALVSLRDYGRLDRLERRCGRRILEAISPLGTPGQRLTDIMLSKAREAGVAIWDGRKVVSLDVQGNTVRGATVLGGMETRDITVDAVMVATGGALVDGLVLEDREVRDLFGRFQVERCGDVLRGGYRSGAVRSCHRWP